ncbi:MAG: hypothetical protein AAGF25_04090 [Pseudomonadota bacterium]
MRLIGIGLLAFLLAGVVLLFSTLDIWQNGRRYIDEIIEGPQLVFETMAAVDSESEASASILRTGSNQPLVLSGLPSYQSAEFYLPMAARPTAGFLQIDATFQVSQGVEGVLRVSIDNAKRGEVLLRPGEVSRSLRIELTPSDLIRKKLVVSFSLQGQGANPVCSNADGIEAVVEIEASSALQLKLDQPLTNPGDQINAWGRVVRVAWPRWLKTTEGLRRLLIASDFKRNGINTAFIDRQDVEALTTVQLREASIETATYVSKSSPTLWPIPLAAKGSNLGLRKFYRSTIWRERYDLRKAPGQKMPERLRLAVILGAQLDGAQWSLAVTLNNRLVFQEQVEATGGKYTANIGLPANFHKAKNVVEISATSTRHNEGECNRGPEFIAELLPETVLVAGNGTYADSLTKLRAQLAEAKVLAVNFASLPSAADASMASDLLAELVPETVALKPGFEGAEIVVLTPDLQLQLQKSGPESFFAYIDPETQLLRVEPAISASGEHQNRVALLVSPMPIALEVAAHE